VNTLSAMEVRSHRLAAMLEAAGRGTFPAPDGTVEVLPPPPGLSMGVVAFTAHYVIATAAPEEWVRAQLPDDNLLAPMRPRFLAALGDQLGLRDDGVDVLLAAEGLPGRGLLREITDEQRPRMARPAARREGVRAFTDPSGLATLLLGRGFALRQEVAIEVPPTHRGRGIAARALVEIRRVAAPDEVLFAQIAPGNAASLRTFLTAGFRPIGSEALFFGA
jgi:GNAT superfamily N-acetyltransferase